MFYHEIFYCFRENCTESQQIRCIIWIDNIVNCVLNTTILTEMRMKVYELSPIPFFKGLLFGLSLASFSQVHLYDFKFLMNDQDSQEFQEWNAPILSSLDFEFFRNWVLPKHLNWMMSSLWWKEGEYPLNFPACLLFLKNTCNGKDREN